MAILKHITSKNADYGEAQRYLMFQYDEAAMKPVLDESGRMIPREEYYLDGIINVLLYQGTIGFHPLYHIFSHRAHFTCRWR